ncbi:MAG: zinc-dependent alcohol dehydrogenase family protein [Isosphaeraceae bacterium]
MKAAVLHRNGPIESSPLKIEDFPEPAPAAGELLVRVKCCAICRTDLHVIEGDLKAVTLPIIPGHQVVGTVEALGPGCHRFDLGARVGIAWLRSTCGACKFCRSGRENLCPESRYTGYHEHGGYAELTTVREDFAYPLPATIDDSHAAPLLCAGIIGYRALVRSNLPKGGTLGIFGFGQSAHLMAQIARSWGCTIYVVTRGKGHQDLARRLGALWASETIDGMPGKLDSAIIFAPAGELVPQALSCLEKGGTLAMAGIYMSAIPVLDYTQHLFYERDLRSVTSNTRQDGEDLLREAARIPIRPEMRHYAFDQVNQALEDLKADRISGTGLIQIGK